MSRLSREQLIGSGAFALFLTLTGLTGGDKQPSVAHAALNILNNRPPEHTLMQTIPPVPTEYAPTLTPTPPTVPTVGPTNTPEGATLTPTPGMPPTEGATIAPTSQEFTPTPTPLNQDMTPTPTSTPQPIGFISGRALDANGLGIANAQVTVHEPGGVVVENRTNRWGEYNEHDVTQHSEVYTMTLGPVLDNLGVLVQELDDTQFVVEPQSGEEVTDISISTADPLGSELTVIIDDANQSTRSAVFIDGTVKATGGKDANDQMSASIYTGNKETREGYAGAHVSDIDGAATLTLNQSFSDVEVTGSDPDGVSIAFGEGTQTLTVTTAVMEPGVTYSVAAQITQGEADIVQQNPDGSIEQSKGVDSDGDGTIDVTEQTSSSMEHRIFLPTVQR